MPKNELSILASRRRAAWALKLGAVAVAATALLGATGCQKLSARDNLNRGVQAYRNANYEVAIERFRKAVQQDPSLLTARLYLATAYANLVTPDIDTPENKNNAKMTIDTYNEILNLNLTTDQKILAYKGLASTYEKVHDWENAKKYWGMLAQLDPNDPQTYYRLGVIEWANAYKDTQEAKQKIGKGVEDDIVKDTKLCADLKAKNEARIEHGMDMLNKAIQLRPDYDDAMAYLNLLYRRKADMVESADERASLQKQADELIDKVKEIKQKRAEQPPAQAS